MEIDPEVELEKLRADLSLSEIKLRAAREIFIEALDCNMADLVELDGAWAAFRKFEEMVKNQ